MRWLQARVAATRAYWRWWLDTLHCEHPAQAQVRISGDERQQYGYRSRCTRCGRALDKDVL